MTQEVLILPPTLPRGKAVPFLSLPQLEHQGPNFGWEGKEKLLYNHQPPSLPRHPPALPRPGRPPFCRSDSSSGLLPSPLPWEGTLQAFLGLSRANFPLLWPKPGLSLHLAEGLEKPRSATAGNCRQRPISCAKRPGRNSFQPLPRSPTSAYH